MASRSIVGTNVSSPHGRPGSRSHLAPYSSDGAVASGIDYLRWRLIFKSVSNCSAVIRFFWHPFAMSDAATHPHEVPTPVCNGCGAQMKHLTDHRSSGQYPAERIFFCRSCRSVISERR